MKINKVPEFYVIFAREKNIKMPEFLYFHEKLTKFPNFVIFVPIFVRKMPEFNMMIARKMFCHDFFGGGTCPLRLLRLLNS